MTRPKTQAAARPATTQLRTLVQFVRDQRRVGCPVCALPVAVRGQLAEAAAKKIPRQVQLDWLRTECKNSITAGDLDRHRTGRHDAPD
jgi:cytolysin (calcineurin-like family phosphatase)